MDMSLSLCQENLYVPEKGKTGGSFPQVGLFCARGNGTSTFKNARCVSHTGADCPMCCCSCCSLQRVANIFCPLLFQPYGVLNLHCDWGIMVTASHNPKEDNGYKAGFTFQAEPPYRLPKKYTKYVMFAMRVLCQNRTQHVTHSFMLCRFTTQTVHRYVCGVRFCQQVCRCAGAQEQTKML